MKTDRVKVSAGDSDVTQLRIMLNAGQGRATARTCDVSDVIALAKYGEERLEKLKIPKKIRTGARADYFPPSVANSYNYRADGTYLTLTRGSSDWYLTEVSRGNAGSCSYGSGSARIIRLTVEQQMHCIRANPLFCDVVPLPRESLDWELVKLASEKPKELLKVTIAAKGHEVPEHQRTTLEEM